MQWKTDQHLMASQLWYLQCCLRNRALSVQASSMQKDQSIRQLNAKIIQAERDSKKAQDKFQEEKVLLTNRETELLKAKADVGINHSFCKPQSQRYACSAYPRPCRLELHCHIVTPVMSYTHMG